MTKFKLLRDGQIVGYERINGSGVTERSYDNQTWGIMEIPNDTKKAFITFDVVNLVEIYET